MPVPHVRVIFRIDQNTGTFIILKLLHIDTEVKTMVQDFSKFLLVVLFTLFAITVSVSSVNAGCAIDVSATTTNWFATKDTGQSFTAPCSGLLHSITVHADEYVTGVTLIIYNGESVDEGDQIYYQSNITLTDPVTIILSGSVNVVENQMYTFRFTGGSGNHWLTVNNSNPYAGGRGYNSGWMESFDLIFKVEIIDPTPPTKVVLTGPATVLKDGLGAFTITALDVNDRTSNVTDDTVFNLISSSSGTTTFYSNSTGTTSITGATIANGESSVTFYCRDDGFGTPTITATRASGMELGSANKQIRVSGNNALSFDPEDPDDYVIGSHRVMTNTDNWTIMAWVRLDTIVPNQNQIAVYNGDDSGGYGFGFYNGGLRGLYGGVAWHDTGETVTAGTWNHVAMRRDSGTLRFYLNGKLLNDPTSTTDPKSPYDLFTLGNMLQADHTSLYAQSLDGQIDEVSFWDEALTEGEIRANMHRELQGNESGLAGYYKLDTGTGTTAYDSSGNSNDGTLTNGPAWQTSGAMSGPGNALDFADDTDGYVNCGTIDLSGPEVTFEAWIYPEGFQTSSPYISGIMGEEVSSSNLALMRLGDAVLDKNNIPQFVLSLDGSDRKLWGKTELSADTWYHLAATYDGSSMIIYINGKEDASAGQSGSITANASFWISQVPMSRPFNGRMDEVRVWNVARTAQQIRDNMCKSLQGDEPGLVAYYRMDQQSVAEQTTLYDQTPNGHDGELIDMDPDPPTTPVWVSSTAFNTWIGSNNTEWATAANWGRGGAPASTDNVGIPDYSNTTGYPAGNAPEISGTPTVNHFVLASDAGATLSSGLTVNGNLILESNLDLNGQTITLGSDGYLIEDAGRLYGTTGTITTTRTLSNISSENVAGLGAQLTTAANMGSTVITRGHSAVSEGVSGLQKSIYRYYQITPDPNTGLNATLKFYYNENELNSIPEADLALFRYDSGESKWQCNAANQDRDAANNWVQQTGIDVFSKWTLGDEDDPTLVDLVSFTARGFEDFVRFEWETASEIDNAGFHLWRSQTKGGAYTKITEMLIPAEGGPTFGVEYEYADFDVALGKTWYYKLEDISNTGVSTFHGPVMAVVGDAAVKVVDGPTTLGEGDTAQGMGEIIIEGTGKHTVTTGRYANNPAGAPTFTPTGDYWFVDVTDLSGLNSVTTRFCPADSNNTVYYWNGGGWVKCSQQEYTDGCIAVMITDTTSPRISDLTNLVFAMGRQSAAIPTLSEWGMIVLSLILGTVAVLALRRRRLVIGHWS